MSVWVEGRRYDYYGVPIECVRRWFDGPLEMVDFRFVRTAAVVPGAWPTPAPILTRTARAIAPCVVPRVTETLGGVLRGDACDHRHYPRVRANAGPHAGAECCEACGTPEGAPDAR